MFFTYRPKCFSSVSTSQGSSSSNLPNPVLPVNPALPVKTRTMQITLPENATHIVICTASNERKEIQIPRFPSPITPVKQQQQQQQVKQQQVQQQQQQVQRKKFPKSFQENVEISKVANKKTSSRLEHACGECGKKYSTSSNLARHKQTHRWQWQSSFCEG